MAGAPGPEGASKREEWKRPQLGMFPIKQGFVTFSLRWKSWKKGFSLEKSRGIHSRWSSGKEGAPDVLRDLSLEEIGLGRPRGSTQGIGNFPMDSSPEFPFPAGIRAG